MFPPRGVCLGARHAGVLAVATVVDAKTSMLAVEDIRLGSTALQIVQPDLSGPCEENKSRLNP